MSRKLVTSRQTDSIRDMANAKGVTCAEFQKALDDGSFGRFLDLIRNGNYRPVGTKLPIIKKFNPVNFLGKGWSVWRGPADGDGLVGDEDIDPRGEALTEVEFSKVVFTNDLKPNEISITGEEKLRRQKESGVVRFGGNVFLACWENNDRLNDLVPKHVNILVFTGMVLRGPRGHRDFLYLFRYAGGWSWDYYYLGNDWYDNSSSVGLAS